MNYPLISEYIEAIKSAEDNFDELSHLRPVLDEDGLPVMTSGNFAVVFKMQDERDGKLYAVKCFTKEQEGRAEAYREITKELKNVDSPYLTSVRYLDKELFVDTDQTDETEFPVLLMDWVEGKTLDKYLRENLDDKYALEMLAYRFSQLAQWLIPQPFAHGDLKPDNILVRDDGTLVLVDYDGMYVPAMKGQKARELGSPDFRHPLRTENDFDEHIDDFPLVSIQLSLKSISLQSELYMQFGKQYRLLFSENDYRDVNKSDVIKRLFALCDTGINRFIVAILHYIFNGVKARYPIQYLISDGYSLEISKLGDRYKSNSNKFVDEYGVEYTSDKKILLGWNILKENFPSSYKVAAETEIICDKAFMHCKNLTSIQLPQSLKYLGENVFAGSQLSHIDCESSSFETENNILYSYDRTVLYYYPADRNSTYFEVPEQVRRIVRGCFSTVKNLWVVKLNHIMYDFDELIFSNVYFSIPKGTKRYLNVNYTTYGPPGEKYPDKVEVRSNIFEGDLLVEDGVVYSSDKTILYRYPYWLDNEEYSIDANCKIIEEAAFDDSSEMDEWGMHVKFNKLKTLYLPFGLDEIKDYAFVGCGQIENLTIPSSVEKIGNYVFGQCVNLTTLTFLSKIGQISEKSFHIGITMPGDLVNPYVPYALLGWKRNEIDIIICPKSTDEHYKEILNNNNSQILVLNKDEYQFKQDSPDCFYDKDYFLESIDYIHLITPQELRERLKEVVCVKYYGLAGEGIGLDLSKLKSFLGAEVFNVNKSTNRFYYRQSLNGICYVTKNYRCRFVSDDESFASIDDAIDFACRIYFDLKGH